MAIERLRKNVKGRFFYVIGSLVLFASIMSFVYWVQQISTESATNTATNEHIGSVDLVTQGVVKKYLTSMVDSLAKDIKISERGVKSSLGQLDVFNEMDIIADSAIIFENTVYQKKDPNKKLTRNFIYNESKVSGPTIYSTTSYFHYLQPISKTTHSLYLIIDKKFIHQAVASTEFIESLNKVGSSTLDHKLIFLVFFVGLTCVFLMLIELQSVMVFIVTRYEEIVEIKDDNLKSGLTLKQLVKINVGQIKKLLGDLTITAFKDGVTKLGNRNALLREVEVLENKSQRSPATLIHIRLLELLSFRDQYGGKAMRSAIHAATVKIKEELAKHKENIDLKLYRVCEDELCILTSNKERDVIDSIIKGLVDALSQKILIDSVSAKIEINLAVGVSMYPSHDKSLGNIINTAELSMQRASEDKDNNVVFFNELPQSKLKQMKVRSIDTVIESALENSEFYLLYQPVFSHKNNRNSIVGFEALLRSNNKILSQFNISEIIGAAEHGDVIAMLGRFVIVEATKQLKSWQQDNIIEKDVFISVNISTYQFFNDSLESLVLDTIRNIDLDPKNLRLEFKQDIYKPHNKVLRASIKDVRAHGVSVILDDFDVQGLGYALQINNMVDGIKIDRRWVADAQEKNSFELITSMINLGKYLNIKIGISGVEDALDIPKLATMGCDEIQGYAFSKPEKANFIENQLLISASL